MPAPADKSTPKPAEESAFIPPLCAVFRRFLKRKGLKFTEERAAILDRVLQEEGVFEADTLLLTLSEAGLTASKATVYRTLKHLLEAGIIQEVLLDASRAHYRLAFGRKPSGHLVCLETHQIIEFPTEELDKWVAKVCAAHGYQPLSHRFVIYGLSPAARQQGQ